MSLVMLSLAVTAATPMADAQSEGGSPFIIDRQRTDRVQPTAPATTAKPPKRAPLVQNDAQDGSHVSILGIRFEGTSVPARVADAARNFVGRAADPETLKQLSQAMSDAYAKTDIALYTILIPDQDFAKGLLRVRVVEGAIDAVEVNLQGRSHRLLRAYAAALEAEHPLRRPTVERYLSLMRDVAGVTVDAQFVAGSHPGDVKLVISARRHKPTLRFAYDNRATQILGNGQFQAIGTAYGAIREGDQTDLVASAAPDLKRYRYIGLTHSTPIGDEGLRLQLTGGYLRTNPHKTALHGDARLAGITLSDPVIRGYRRNLTISASVDGLNSDNAAFGALITSEHTRAARAAAAFSDTGKEWSITAGATVSRGLDMLNARANTTLGDPTFTKFNANLAIEDELAPRLIGRIRLSGQYSRDPLPAAELFVVGGSDFGRGFEVALLSTDRGAAGSAELAWRPISAPSFAKSELYGFVDGATVSSVARGLNPSARYRLASAGGGVRAAYNDRAAISLELAHPIANPYPGYHARLQVTVGWTLALAH